MFMPKKGWKSGCIHRTVCLGQRRGKALLYSWNSVFVLEEGELWLHLWNCVKRRGGNHACKCDCVFVSEKGWNFAIFMEHCVCVREGVELCYIH